MGGFAFQGDPPTPPPKNVKNLIVNKTGMVNNPGKLSFDEGIHKEE